MGLTFESDILCFLEVSFERLCRKSNEKNILLKLFEEFI